MKTTPFSAISIIVGLLAAAGGIAVSAQDRYTPRVPNGLSFSEFKGYENWRDVAVSQTETSLKVISANDVMINAYRLLARRCDYPLHLGVTEAGPAFQGTTKVAA